MNASAALSESGTGRYVAVLFGIKWDEIHQGSNPGRVTTSRPRERRPPRQLEGFFCSFPWARSSGNETGEQHDPISPLRSHDGPPFDAATSST